MMKKRYKILLTVVVLLGIAYFCLPYYARQALLYWYPSIDDLVLTKLRRGKPTLVDGIAEDITRGTS
ncbi:MAG: hypothetical protein ACLU4J_09075 [Butyricimonas paravirosa]